MTRFRWLTVTIAATCVTLAAQQDAKQRGRYAGWVEDLAGKRVTNADVTLLSRPLPSRPDLGKPDELHVRTGEDGMFRTTLLHGRAYSAWATWTDSNQQQQRSKILEDVVPGPPRAIVAARPQILRKIRIEGSKLWQDRAPLTLTAYTSADNVAVIDLPLDETFACELPTLPGDWCDFEVRDKGGTILSLLMSKKLAKAESTEQAIKMSKPHALRILVVDDNETPIAGALVRHAFGYHRRDLMSALGHTDKQGALQIVVPSLNTMYTSESETLCGFQITAPGHQRISSWTHLGKVGDTFQVTLPAGIDLLGRVLAKDGSPAKGITLLPDCYAMGADNASTGTGVAPRPLKLDAEGRFHFSSLHPQYDYRLLALLQPDLARAQGMKLREGIAVAPVMWFAVGAPTFNTPHKLEDLRLDQIPIAQIRVTTAAGVPVPGARLMATTEDLYNSPMKYVCDRVGRLQFPLPKNSMHIGAWIPGGGVKTLMVTPPDSPKDGSIDPLIIKLSETYTVRGVIVDPNGKPIAGAKVYQWNRAKIDDRKLAELTFQNRAISKPSDAEGRFSLTLPLADAAFAVRAYGRIDGVMHNTEEILIDPNGEDNERLRIELSTNKK